MAPSSFATSLENDLYPLSAHHHLLRRNLSVNDTQKVTLGVIVAYVVVIALLWNLPLCTMVALAFQNASNSLPRVQPRSHIMLHWWESGVHLP